MKRLIAIFAAIAFAFSLAACSGEGASTYGTVVSVYASVDDGGEYATLVDVRDESGATATWRCYPSGCKTLAAGDSISYIPGKDLYGMQSMSGVRVLKSGEPPTNR